MLQAPPGAGKTTAVPPAILDAGLVPGRILMLEPRRLAARAAAERIAAQRGEGVGGAVGYRIRGEARVSRATRIEIVTEGILARMIQADPALEGVGCVVFDEFHERSLDADLGLALVLEARAAIRPDLMVVVMSATLDAAPVAALMGGAPVVTAQGRAHPVETHWLPRPLRADARTEVEAAALTLRALEEMPAGTVLVFLPGEAEIRRTEAALRPRLPPGCATAPLYGAMDLAAQRAALAPAAVGRRVVLATAIAETSLTIPGVTAVVDAGLARRARFDPGSGMARLVTERVTRAEADQRRGRAGRVAPGRCYRMWSRGEEGGLAPFPPPEIEATDLAGLALELALWGGDPGTMAFLTPPPAPALAAARALLADLGALDDAGRITPHGRAMAVLPLHPRLAHMLLRAGAAAAPLAALLADRDPLRGAAPDLGLRLEALAKPGPAAHRPTVDRIRDEARRLARRLPAEGPELSPAQMAALAYPDRIGLRRPGDAPRWVLSGGKGVAMAAGLALSGERLIVVTDTDGDPREAQVRQAAPIPEADLRAVLADRIRWHDICAWQPQQGRVRATRQERLGALVLAERPWAEAPPEALARAALDGLRQAGLPWTPAARRLARRAALCRAADDALPDLSEPALLAGGALLPHLGRARSLADLRALDLHAILQSLLGRDALRRIDALAPAAFATPLGRAVPIDYDGETPAIAVRVQEMFGVARHPTVGARRLPLRITLLSPGSRPVQVTSDLPGFWAASYAEVRRDLRGRYPRHPWPENPTEALPTLRTKPRGP